MNLRQGIDTGEEIRDGKGRDRMKRRDARDQRKLMRERRHTMSLPNFALSLAGCPLWERTTLYDVIVKVRLPRPENKNPDGIDSTLDLAFSDLYFEGRRKRYDPHSEQ